MIVREESRRVVTVHFLRLEASLRVPFAMKKPLRDVEIHATRVNGISCRDLQNIFEKFGAKRFVGVLCLPPSSTTSKAPRVTKITRILAKIVEHYKAAEETTS